MKHNTYKKILRHFMMLFLLPAAFIILSSHALNEKPKNITSSKNKKTVSTDHYKTENGNFFSKTHDFFSDILSGKDTKNTNTTIVAGTTAGSFSVNLGAANYSIPVTVTPGTGSMQPNISLNYSSNGSNGHLGHSWSLTGLSSIVRTGADKTNNESIDPIDFDANDKFYLDGQLLVCINGTYGASGAEYRKETDDFTKVISYGNVGDDYFQGPQYFEAWTKSGLIYEYANTSDSRIEASGRTDVAVWKVSKITDTKGNYMTFSYYENNTTGENYITQIDYTGNANTGLETYNSIVFMYSDRPDVQTKYAAGSKITASKRLTRIIVKNEESIVRAYVLTYQNINNNQSQLSGIQEVGSDGTFFNPTTFIWQTTALGTFGAASDTYVNLARPPYPTEPTVPVCPPEPPKPYDFNRPPEFERFFNTNDWTVFLWTDCYRNVSDQINPHHYNSWGTAVVNYSDGLPWVSDRMIEYNDRMTKYSLDITYFIKYTWPAYKLLADKYNRDVRAYNNDMKRFCSYQEEMADVNGDGFPDIVAFSDNHVLVARARGDGTFRQPYPTEGLRYNFGYNQDWKIDTTLRFLADVNGDCMADIVGFGRDSVFVSLSNGNGSFAPPELGVADRYCFAQGWKTDKHPRMLADVNGDGFADIVGFSNSYVLVSLGRGDGTFQENKVGIANRFCYAQGWRTDKHPRFLTDVNGDGLPDIVGCSSTSVMVSLNKGDGTFYENIVGIADAYGYNQGWKTDKHLRDLIDVNGDGLADIVGFAERNVVVSLCKGNGKFAPSVVGIYGKFCYEQGWKTDRHPRHLQDVNGDGFPDIVGFASANVMVSLNNGNGTFDSDIIGIDRYGYNHGWRVGEHSRFVTDLDGDGIADILGLKGNYSCHVSLSNPGGNKLSKITDGLGKEININYKPLTDASIYRKGTDAVYPNVDLKPALNVVSSYSVSNGIEGGVSTLKYEYGGLVADLLGKGGFSMAWNEVTDSVSGNKTKSWYSQDYHYQGLPTTTETRLSNNRLVSKTVNTPAVKLLGTGLNERWFPYIYTSVNNVYRTNGDFVYTGTKTETYDDYGNLKYSKVEYSDGNTTETNNIYDDNLGYKWFLGRLKQSTITKTAAGKDPMSRTVDFIYDETSGMLKKETLNSGNANYQIVKEYTHDAYGNVLSNSSTGHRGWTGEEIITESSTYDNKGRFLLTNTNALGHTEVKAYNQLTGNIISRTGPNGLETNYTYDGFGRKKTETLADGNTITNTYIKGKTGDAPDGTVMSVKSIKSGEPELITHFDVLAREIRTEKTGFDGRKIFSDVVYNKKGEKWKTSDPYYKGSPPQWTEFTYDDTGYGLTSNSFTGIVENTYAGLTTTYKNELRQTSSKTTNCIGKLLSTKDNLFNTTTYTYDSWGNLVSVKYMNDDEISIKHDINGNVREITDPDLGIVTNLYNAFGEVYETTDNKGNKQYAEYDKLGRVTKKTTLEGITDYTYDTSDNAIGKLSSLSTTGYSETYGYDNYGRLNSTTVKIGDVSYTTGQTFDDYGRIQNTEYPGDFSVTNVYNSYGYLYQVKNTNDNNLVYFTGNTVNALGQMDNFTLGNDLLTDLTFDKIGRPTDINTGNGTIQNLHYEYNEISNLKQRKDLKRNLTEDFGFDPLDRINTCTIKNGTTTVAGLTTLYHANGNISYKSDIGCYHYDHPTKGHAVTSIEGDADVEGVGTYIYDDNGNLTSYSGNGTVQGYNVDYNSTNLVTEITKGTEKLNFFYNPNGERYKQEVRSNGILSKTIYYLGNYEKVVTLTGAQEKHYINANGSVIAVYTQSSNHLYPSETVYLHKDHLGSVTEITDSNGEIKESFSYDAWGKRRDSETWMPIEEAYLPFYDRGFTFHEHLDEVGLIHMNGRVYNPTVGRFLSADPYIQTLANSQCLNRYSYVLNSPLSITDPSGFNFIGDICGEFGRIMGQAFDIVFQIMPIIMPIIITAALIYCGVPYLAAVFVANVYVTIGMGGTWRQALKAGAFATATAWAGSKINLIKGNSWKALTARGIAGGVLEGSVTAAQGGKFENGFLSGLTRSLGNDLLVDGQEALGKHIAKALVGGTASAIGGGKFSNGAVSAFWASIAEDTCAHYNPDNIKKREEATEKLKQDVAEYVGDDRSDAVNFQIFGDKTNNSIGLDGNNLIGPGSLMDKLLFSDATRIAWGMHDIFYGTGEGYGHQFTADWRATGVAWTLGSNERILTRCTQLVLNSSMSLGLNIIGRRTHKSELIRARAAGF